MKRLPRLSRGGSLTPAQWDSVARVIEDNLRSLTLQPGVGYTVTNSPGGVSMRVGGAGKNGAGGFLNPFSVLTRTDSSGQMYYGVTDGKLFNTLDPSSYMTITGLLSGGANSAPEDGGWFSMSVGGVASPSIIYLEINVLTASVEVKHGTYSDFNPLAGPWNDESLVTLDPDSTTAPRQKYARVGLATLATEDSVVTITQRVTTNMMMQSYCAEGFQASYPQPTVF